MKIAVIGPGALGTVFGGLLWEAGHDVWLLHHREDFVETVNENGIRIDDHSDGTAAREIDVPATTDAAQVGHVDLGLVLVKSHATIEAITQHESCIGPETRMLSLQNGVSNHHRLRDHLGPDRTLHGVTRQGGMLAGPGHAIRTGEGPTILGGPDREFAERIAHAFREVGIDTKVVEDPWRYIWEKQALGGAIKPTASLTGLPNGKLANDEAIREVMLELVRECERVARAEGHPIDGEAVCETIRNISPDSSHKSSMLQDVEARTKTEIDDCNGAVLELAASHGIDVPQHETMTALVRGRERAYLDAD